MIGSGSANAGLVITAPRMQIQVTRWVGTWRSFAQVVISTYLIVNRGEDLIYAH